MIAIFAAMSAEDESFFLWVIMGVAVLWWFYMMTFRTDDWLRLVKDEQERKAKRRERNDKLFGDAFNVAKWWLKK
jgi:hypothetical protein